MRRFTTSYAVRVIVVTAATVAVAVLAACSSPTAPHDCGVTAGSGEIVCH
jgi:hypothetical protein